MKAAGLRNGAAGLLCLWMALGAAGDVRAAILPPTNTVLTTTGHTYPALADGYLANNANGTQIASLTAPFTTVSGTPPLSGYLVTEVIQNDTTNPYVAGGGSYGPGVSGALTFIFELINNPNPPSGPANLPLTNLSLHSFDFYGTDVGYDVLGSATVVPFKILRSTDGNGDLTAYGLVTIGWTGANTIQPNQNSAYLIVNTNATNYTSTFASIQGGSISRASSYAPTPEPSTVALLAAGLGSMAVGALRRRFRKA